MCIDGCEAGYFGDQCIVKCYGKCLDGTCDAEGSCPDCKLDPVGDNCHPKGMSLPSLKKDKIAYIIDSVCNRLSGVAPSKWCSMRLPFLWEFVC